MTNNDIFKKLRVALMLRDDQIVEILELVDFRISKGEIGNFFRAEDHPKFVNCGDQVLRNFLNGLVIYLRGTKEAPKNPMEILGKHKNEASKKSTDKPKSDFKEKPKTDAPKKPKTGFNPNNKKPKQNPVMDRTRFNNGKNKKS